GVLQQNEPVGGARHARQLERTPCQSRGVNNRVRSQLLEPMNTVRTQRDQPLARPDEHHRLRGPQRTTRQPEPTPQVDYGNDLATDVDHTVDDLGCSGQRRDRDRALYLAHVRQRHRTPQVTNVEAKNLVGCVRIHRARQRVRDRSPVGRAGYARGNGGTGPVPRSAAEPGGELQDESVAAALDVEEAEGLRIAQGCTVAEVGDDTGPRLVCSEQVDAHAVEILGGDRLESLEAEEGLTGARVQECGSALGAVLADAAQKERACRLELEQDARDDRACELGVIAVAPELLPDAGQQHTQRAGRAQREIELGCPAIPPGAFREDRDAPRLQPEPRLELLPRRRLDADLELES